MENGLHKTIAVGGGGVGAAARGSCWVVVPGAVNQKQVRASLVATSAAPGQSGALRMPGRRVYSVAWYNEMVLGCMQ